MALTQVKSDGIADGAVTTNDLADSGVTAGTYGSSSAIPAITVDAKGRITSASTNSVTQVGGANGVDFNDNVKARFGTGNDLEIYHDGSHNYIDGADGQNIYIRTGDHVVIRNGTTNETSAKFLENGSVELYYDNSKKFETTSGGINVTGTVTCDGLTSDGDITLLNTTGTLIIKDSNDSNPLGAVTRVKGQTSDGSDRWYVGDMNTGNSNVDLVNVESASLRFGTGNTIRASFNSSGHFVPNANNTYDLGSNSLQFRDAYFDGTVRTDNLTCDSVANFNHGAAGAVTVAGNGDIRLGSGSTWTGESPGKIQHHGNWLYFQAGSNGIIFRSSGGSDRCKIDSSGHLTPSTNNAYDLGTSSLRWRNVYTNDLNLSNEGGTNDVDGTWGSWTIQEGEDDLFLLNRRNGKKYKFNLTEVN